MEAGVRVDEGLPADCDAKAKACASQFGSLFTKSNGRADGTLVAVVRPSDTQCALPNATHVVLQLSILGQVQRLVVAVDGVAVTQVSRSLVGPAYAEGWHPDTQLDYPTDLGVHSDDFSLGSMDQAVSFICSPLHIGGKVSVYAHSDGSSPSSAHQIHRNDNYPDGNVLVVARPLDVTGANTPTGLREIIRVDRGQIVERWGEWDGVGLLGCQPEEIIFTSGGMQANNLAIRGVLERVCAARTSRRHVVTSTVEHPATVQPCELLQRRHGVELTRLPVDPFCRIDPELARQAVRADTALVSVMLAQNETGTLMPIRDLAAVAHDRGALIHSDAARAVGKIPTRVDELGIDLLSMAGHKLYAPQGVGALSIRRTTSLDPVLVGAGHERGVRPGTENVPFIVGPGVACKLAAADLAHEAGRQQALRDALWQALHRAVDGLVLNGSAAHRLPNTLNVSFPGVRGSAVLAAAPAVAASTGSACHAGNEVASDVLRAMGLDATAALGAVRLSLGRGTTLDLVQRAAVALIDGYRQASRDTGRPG